jgi:dolichyl-phosphate-mannose--protein O-mannosyl transferase
MIFSQDSNTVTYGSNIKLVHKDSNHLLHSHSIAWGSGSGQQSVTATATLSDPNSLWVVKEPVKGSDNIELATPIKCGSIISLEHAGTGIYYNSFLFLIIILN